MYEGFGGWWWGMGMLHGLLWLVLVVLGIVVLVRLISRDSRPSGAGSGSGESALDILAKRYARGEIDRDEFETKRRDLAQ